MSLRVQLRERTVGQCFGTFFVLVVEGTDQEVARSAMAPFGFASTPIRSLKTEAEDRGWTIVP